MLISFNSRPSCEGRPRQKLNFAGFSALEAPKRCYYIKDYEPQMSKIDDFAVCCLYDVAENGKTSANLLEKSCELEVRGGGSR